MQPGHLNPARLPLGTKVGPWRVLERCGLGAYGAVYRAVDAKTKRGTVALKLALHPGDARFAREAELLSRVRHPSVPRLLDQGVWPPLAARSYPYVAMEWVEGVSLYDWALDRRPTSRQVLQVLASLARALEATHGAGGVHRDVKGDNVLVSDVDGRVFLTDFGSGHYIGAATLTRAPFPPGTPDYRSPEAWRSVRLPMLAPVVPYAPVPADDVFALGVTAFRLVTDTYPFPDDPTFGFGQADAAALPYARAVNARCCAELSALISCMLSIRPEERGSARELAEALEEAADEAGPEADVPLFAGEEAPRLVEGRAAARPIGRTRRPWLVAASLGGALALGSGWLLDAHPGEDARTVHASMSEEGKDGGTIAVGDSALTAPVSREHAPFAGAPIAEEAPPQPVPGQTRPNALGRCPRNQVPINGGCWKKLAVDAKECTEGDVVYKGACYTPAYPPPRPPTSSPAEGADD
jgi:hypothetical protein